MPTSDSVTLAAVHKPLFISRGVRAHWLTILCALDRVKT
jgi:hypothetical protein